MLDRFASDSFEHNSWKCEHIYAVLLYENYWI
ncbi:MAG: SWIM zinc finger family protein [Parashewanella sp.]